VSESRWGAGLIDANNFSTMFKKLLSEISAASKLELITY
jgi:hypothetical protein